MKKNYYLITVILSSVLLLNACSSKPSREVKEEDGKFYVFDSDGNPLSESLIPLQKRNLYMTEYYVIDNKGEFVYKIEGQKNNLFIISTEKGEGIMAPDGEIIVEPKYTYIKFDRGVVVPYNKKEKALAVRVSDKKKLCDDIYTKIVVLSPDIVFGYLDSGMIELWVHGKKRVKASDGFYTYFSFDEDENKIYGITNGRKTFLFNLNDL